MDVKTRVCLDAGACQPQPAIRPNALHLHEHRGSALGPFFLPGVKSIDGAEGTWLRDQHERCVPRRNRAWGSAVKQQPFKCSAFGRKVCPDRRLEVQECQANRTERRMYWRRRFQRLSSRHDSPGPGHGIEKGSKGPLRFHRGEKARRHATP